VLQTIFVLDDDPDQAEMMAEAIAGHDRHVRAFSDPIRALAALTSDGADVLIADLSMPWIDGRDVVLSARLRRPELAIIMVSGYPRGVEIAEAEGVRFFPKPLDLDRLRGAVDEALAVQPRQPRP
jgi:DNA-binding NtrC family response regulator